MQSAVFSVMLLAAVAAISLGLRWPRRKDQGRAAPSARRVISTRLYGRVGGQIYRKAPTGMYVIHMQMLMLQSGPSARS